MTTHTVPHRFDTRLRIRYSKVAMTLQMNDKSTVASTSATRRTDVESTRTLGDYLDQSVSVPCAFLQEGLILQRLICTERNRNTAAAHV
jgi:hypothetical protein